jgi:predicted RNA binding protein YcfA (HicA-like mRNA interferase family)
MKKRLVIKALTKYGWWKKREGANHEVWTNGDISQPVARHNDIPERTADGIIKKAKQNPAKN